MSEVLNEDLDHADSAKEGLHFGEVFARTPVDVFSTLEGLGMWPSGVQMCPTMVISHVHNNNFLLENIPPQYFIRWTMWLRFWKCSQTKWRMPLFSGIVLKVLLGTW